MDGGVMATSRREFLRLGAGSVVVLGFGAAACSGKNELPFDADATDPTSTTAPGSSTTAGSTAPATSIPPTSAPAANTNRRLVIVQMNGGNDCLNTVVPIDGRYHDARPTLAIADADLLSLAGVSDVAWHPSLAPLMTWWDQGRLAMIQGIGFEDPDRSHFVSMDRWWRADDLSAPGWLGRVLDGLAADPEPLYATALGGGAPLLSGATRQPTTVLSSSAFRFDGVDPAQLLAMSSPAAESSLLALAQRSLARTVEAVADFTAVTGGSMSNDEISVREGGVTLTDGLATAAQLLTSDVGVRIVVVSASGFDTHSGQLDVHAGLLDDFANGVNAFFATIEAAGLTDEVLLASTSEFGRRVAENGSGGTDHGAGGMSFLIGSGVRGGVHGAIDLGDLLDGDVRPTVDPRVLYTACLDWMGVDVEQVLGHRYDDLPLLA